MISVTAFLAILAAVVLVAVIGIGVSTWRNR